MACGIRPTAAQHEMDNQMTHNYECQQLTYHYVMSQTMATYKLLFIGRHVRISSKKAFNLWRSRITYSALYHGHPKSQFNAGFVISNTNEPVSFGLTDSF